MGQDLRIGFVGLGRMGANMARRLKETGFHLTAVYDSRQQAAGALAAELGIEAARTPALVAGPSSVVVTVVSDDTLMRKIFAEDNLHSLLSSAKNRLFINCATLTPDVHIEVAQAVERRGGYCLEACTAGSITQARQGTLYLMCGGSTDGSSPWERASSTSRRERNSPSRIDRVKGREAAVRQSVGTRQKYPVPKKRALRLRQESAQVSFLRQPYQHGPVRPFKQRHSCLSRAVPLFRPAVHDKGCLSILFQEGWLVQSNRGQHVTQDHPIRNIPPFPPEPPIETPDNLVPAGQVTSQDTSGQMDRRPCIRFARRQHDGKGWGQAIHHRHLLS